MVIESNGNFIGQQYFLYIINVYEKKDKFNFTVIKPISFFM